MGTPTLHLLAGPNGAGKSTFVVRLLQPSTHLPFVNADAIAAQRWPNAQAEHAYDAANIAAAQRQRFMTHRASFITETVFSHPSKVALVEEAVGLGYLVHLYVILVPVDLSVNRVVERVSRGGHDVPAAKIRSRYHRLWPLITAASAAADHATFYDNSRAATPFRLVATFERGQPVGTPAWPTWTPSTLIA